MIDKIKRRIAALPKGELRYNIDKENPSDRRICLIEEGDKEEKCVCCVALAGNVNEKTGEWEDSTVEQWDAFGELFSHAPEDMKFLIRRIEELEEEIDEIHKDAAGESR